MHSPQNTTSKTDRVHMAFISASILASTVNVSCHRLRNVACIAMYRPLTENTFAVSLTLDKGTAT
jgi:hypothetical protein